MDRREFLGSLGAVAVAVPVLALAGAPATPGPTRERKVPMLYVPPDASPEATERAHECLRRLQAGEPPKYVALPVGWKLEWVEGP